MAKNAEAQHAGAKKSGTKRKDEQQIIEAIERIASQRRIPSATYRLQFNAAFTFRDATKHLGYFRDLGISDIYASPIFLPRAGSTHGYDVADPTKFNSDLGSEEDFDALSTELQKRNMGLLLDIVPNHMGVNDPRNVWWLDVLENGPSSDYASFFDIQWHPIKQEMENKVLLPILGDQYGVVLERGELRLNYAAGNFYLTYYQTMLPLSPRSYTIILRHVLEEMVGKEQTEAVTLAAAPLQEVISGTEPLPTPNLARLELESILTALSYLPPRTETDKQRLAERAREKVIIKRRLETLYSESEEVRAALDRTVERFNGEVGKPESFDLLDELIEAQAYRLAFWRVAGEEINYRRFFDINELAAIRVEEPAVFAATHALALHLLQQGKATGLRIDHPDGLYDPVAYFCRLQEEYLAVKLRAELNGGFQGVAASNNGDERVRETILRWLDEQTKQRARPRWPLYVAVEKILSEREPLPLEWSVDGTTGYSFLADANGIFVDSRNERAITRTYTRFTRNRTPLREIAFSTKMMIMRNSLVGEITALAYELERIGERNRHYRDFTLGGIRTALREVIASLSVYRTYINAHEGIVSEGDRKFIQAAVREAKRRHPLLDDTLFDYIEDTLLLHSMEKFDEEDRPAVAHWVMKFQQLTGPVMAKGVEDTAFYRYNRLVSLNEVGDHPSEFGTSVERFHAANNRRAKLWPHTMLATSTHDNKRSEDVRARINVLSELPDLWQAALTKWSRLNASKKRALEGEAAPPQAPDANDEYLFYQTILGTWPLRTGDAEGAWGFLLPPGDDEEYQTFRQRIIDYMLKAVKEAKVYTSWLNPYQEYEEALARFVDRVLQPTTRNRFLNHVAPLARLVAYFGHINSLAQTLLKLTSPGVPDIYQGNELWDFSLVDPDNRRPVDYARRAALLKEVRGAEKRKGSGKLRYTQELVEQWQDGRIKLFITQRALAFRAAHYDLFTYGSYLPLETGGERSQHLCAFLRHNDQGDQALVVVPRLVASLLERNERPPIGVEVWGDTWIKLPSGEPETLFSSYENIFTGERVEVGLHGKERILPVADLLGSFPVALLNGGR